MLKQKNRLTKRGSFAYVYKKGGCHNDKLIKLFCVRSNVVKIGFSVSNKLGKATVRNKIKRRLRAAMREYVDKISGVQAVFLARQEIVSADYNDIKNAVRRLLIKSGLFDEKEKDESLLVKGCEKSRLMGADSANRLKDDGIKEKEEPKEKECNVVCDTPVKGE